MASRKRVRWVKVSSLWVYRVLTWSVLVAGLTFAAAVLSLRYWILPNIGQYREDIARIVSETVRQKIEIGYIRANWEGLRPQLVLEQVRVLDAEGRPALEFSRVDNTLSWLSLLTLQLRFHALDIHRSALEIRRDAAGAISIAGNKLSGREDGGGFADWLLQQRDIELIDATIAWTDEQRGAPRLEFKHVNLHLINRGKRHRFGLHATPPGELAAPIDLRGDLKGDSVEALAEWNGRLFLQLDYTDIAAWRQWVPFPVDFPRGKGAVRAWLTFSEHHLTSATVDVRLVNVQTRLAAELPELDLAELSGRVGWKSSQAGFEFTAAKLGLTTAGGFSLQPADFRLRVDTGTKRAPAGGELRVDALELEPLVMLADRLPLAQEVRDQLARFSPKGGLRDVAIRWRGDWQKPSGYSVRGRFERLALSHTGKIPGFTGVSGSVDAKEDGGTLYVNTQKAAVKMPLWFRDPLELEVLTAQMSWSLAGGEAEIRLNNVSFSNSHVAGTVFGRFRTGQSALGHIDLTGKITRVDARYVSRYVPLAVGEAEREWLDSALRAGQVTEGSLRIKGNLDDFPFADGTSGVFQVTAKVTGATLHYATGWPVIENISGDVVFRGRRMDFDWRHATVFGAQLSRTHGEILDLVGNDEVLNVTGEVTGPTSEFLTFIEKSPVLDAMDYFTEKWKAQGAGRLTLKLNIPLRAERKIKLAGAFEFAGNTVVVHPEVPALEQASGRVEFTESSVWAKGVTGTVLGGPVSIKADTKRDSTVLIAVQGRVNTDNLRSQSAQPAWLQHVRGATDWHAAITTHERTSDVVLESSLEGLAVYLPPPLLKAAGEALPVRIERRVVSATEDRIGVAVATSSV